ncbi:hypothetical protein JI749_06140 [Devosia oryziradicis]|uniref:Outer membrane protein beta-barrel domain-containing protein n=1 Tax=Devosia oryziradicis TaxID=2801335 RepID=A0ABX7BYZ3_9HYPH|nr:hypothetical protein [Devosia oryziradicis]QQR37189.1 hypothetical protein JI749_06140 [Devosia oryziradicis]
MRKFIATMMVAGAAVVGGQAIAADMPYYPPIIEIPDVDYGVSGSFYLRGSAALNALWAPHVNHPSVPATFEIDGFGYGYSVGAGFGYETGTGLRFDVTADYLSNDGMRATVPAAYNPPLQNGVHTLALRSTVVLANAYYDFGLGGGGYGAGGGTFGYVGAGAGVAFNRSTVTDPLGATTSDNNTSLAAAGMVGVGYDFGQVVADVGYRALYISSIANTTAPFPYTIANNWAHEVRGTIRYRFN